MVNSDNEPHNTVSFQEVSKTIQSIQFYSRIIYSWIKTIGKHTKKSSDVDVDVQLKKWKQRLHLILKQNLSECKLLYNMYASKTITFPTLESVTNEQELRKLVKYFWEKISYLIELPPIDSKDTITVLRQKDDTLLTGMLQKQQNLQKNCHHRCNEVPIGHTSFSWYSYQIIKNDRMSHDTNQCNPSGIYSFKEMIPIGHTIYSWKPEFRIISDGVGTKSSSKEDDFISSTSNKNRENRMMTHGRLRCLIRVIGHLRKIESSSDFFDNKWSAIMQQHSKDTTSTLETFAYGSTTFQLWNDVFNSYSVKKKLHQCLYCPDSVAMESSSSATSSSSFRQYVVFGSSIGWLIFYGSLSLNLNSVGYEILPPLVDIAKDIARTYDIKNAKFYQRNMLDASITEVAVLVLTSQCWDLDLIHAVSMKLERELPNGAVVIDYQSSLDRSAHFDLKESITGSTSWSSSITIYIYEKTK